VRDSNPAVMALYRVWRRVSRIARRLGYDGEVYDALSAIHNSLLFAVESLDRLERSVESLDRLERENAELRQALRAEAS
jgi:hypothetical protein